MYIQNWQLFVYVGPLLWSDLGGGPEPPLPSSRRACGVGNCFSTWERLDVHTELAIVCLRGSPFGLRSGWYARPPPAAALGLRGPIWKWSRIPTPYTTFVVFTESYKTIFLANPNNLSFSVFKQRPEAFVYSFKTFIQFSRDSWEPPKIKDH